MHLLKSSLDCAEKFLGPIWKLISPKPIKQLLQLIPFITKEKTIEINWKKIWLKFSSGINWELTSKDF